MSRRSDLAKIHIAKKAFGMPDETYRGLLRRLTGKTSAAELTAAERRRVIRRFQELGWRPVRRTTEPSGAPAQRRKIAALLEERGRPDAYGEAIAQHMYRRPLAHCSPAQLRGVIAALVKDRQRAEARA